MLTAEEQFAMGEGQHIEEEMGERQEKQGMEGEGESKFEKIQPKAEFENPKNIKKIVVCAMCNGKGYYEEINKPELNHRKKLEENSDNYGKSCALPPLPQGQHYNVEQIYRASEAKVCSRLSDSAVTVPISRTPAVRLPPVHIPNSTSGRNTSAGHVKSTPGNYSYGQLDNLLPMPKKFEKHPEDVARLAAIKLNRNDWETKRAGIEGCLHLAHSYPEELEPYMSLVYRALSALLRCHQPNMTMFTCQAAREFFTHMRSTCRPEYDELVYSLLGRTADVNRYIRLYANDALDKMVTYIPTTHAVRPLVEKGPIHNNPLVRSSTARLLSCVVALKTPNTILTIPQLRDTCKRIVETAAMLLADSNIDVRTEAKKLISRFMAEEEFESFYYAEVDEKLRKRVQRTFIDVKNKTASMKC